MLVSFTEGEAQTPVAINPAHVVSVRPSTLNPGHTIFTLSGGKEVTVNAPFAEAVALLNKGR
jgi:hypothetical protein